MLGQTQPEFESPTRSAPIQPYTMVLDQSAHLDWDWIRSFPQNFWYGTHGDNGVQNILDEAIANLKLFNKDGKRPYYYAICEMGFLRKYVEENPAQVAAIVQAGENFQVIGGGFTSPDCLVCSGEAFIRNYLIGHLWLSQALSAVPPRRQCWIPDDFGQGPELPVLLQALGFVGVGFSRLPGTTSACLRPELKQDLLDHGLDFIWQASDGSQVIAHWIGASYNIGNGLSGGPEAIKDFTKIYNPHTRSPIQYSGAVTPVMYIPIDDDFSLPVPNLLQSLTKWNENQVPGGGERESNVHVTAGTFDSFVAALAPRRDALKLRKPYNGTPYWTGYYASRPELKILHYQALRALVAAEIFALMTQPGDAALKNMLPHGFWQQLAETWTDFAPSTHHDYVCGTAPDATYATEQLPLLRAVAARARGLCSAALNALAGMTPSFGGGTQILVANSLGFGREGIAEITDVAVPGVQSVSFDGGNTFTPVQRSAEGGMLLLSASVPSLGYVSALLSTWQQRAQGPTASITSVGASGYRLENDRLSATVSLAASWGIFSVIDKATGRELLDNAPGNAPGNDLVFYQDGGDIYEFGNEYVDADQTIFAVDPNVTITATGSGLGAIVLESGPLRVRLRTTVLVTVGSGETRIFTRDYTLVAGEPLLRMSTTGAAPAGNSGYSVMTRFSLAAEVKTISHGTAGHWTSVPPLAGFWGPPTFQATHDFLIAQDRNGNALAAIYHEAVPAWAFESSGDLIGCLLRNTPTSRHGAGGTDPAPHTQNYALRVPSQLGAPATGAPLREALAYHTPLRAVEIPAGDGFNQQPGMNAGSFSLAATTSPNAILTVAKPGSFVPTSLILRLYQPTNKAGEKCQVTLGGGAPASLRVVTAAEGEWRGPPTPVQPDSSGFTITMSEAIATVQIDGMGLPARVSHPERT